MAYKLVNKSGRGKILPTDCVSVSKNYIALAQNLKRAFILKKGTKMIKFQYGIFYYDKENKKLKITPSDNYLAGFIYRKGFQSPGLIRKIGLPKGIFYAVLNKNNEIEIDLKKAAEK